MKTLFCWFMMLAATGSAQCSKDLKMAVLNKLDGKFENYNYLSIWMSEDYSVEHWRPRLNAEQAEITKLRRWANGIGDRCVKAAYIDWLDYYQSNLNSAWRELRTKETKIRQDAFEAEQERSRKAQERITVPEPPQ